MSIVIPAVLPSSRKDLEQKLALFGAVPEITRIQIDVVDGKFAAPASWPYTPDSLMCKAEPDSAIPCELREMVKHGEMLPNLHRIEYEIDLMCLDARDVAELWLTLGASRLTFHAESVTNLPQLIAFAHTRFGCGPSACGVVTFGLALNIESDLALVEPYFDKVDYIQFMGIARIGQQGQPFDTRVLEKIRIFHTRYPNVTLQIDGGVSLDRVNELLGSGISQFVVGSALTRSGDIAGEIAKFDARQSLYGV